MLGRAFNSMCGPLVLVRTVSFLPTTNIKFHAKINISVIRYPIRKGNVMVCYKERHPLLLDYFIPFLKCISNVGRAAISVYESLMGQTSCHFCKEQTSNFMQI